jgi:hypothetical protein
VWLGPFSRRARLLSRLESLAFYNERGVEYAGHSPAAADAERAARLGRIRTLVEAIGREQLPAVFLRAMDAGEVAVDMSGRHIDEVRRHFPGRRE